MFLFLLYYYNKYNLLFVSCFRPGGLLIFIIIDLEIWSHLIIDLTFPCWVWPPWFHMMSGPQSLPTNPHLLSPWQLRWNIDPEWSVLPLNWSKVKRDHYCSMCGCVRTHDLQIWQVWEGLNRLTLLLLRTSRRCQRLSANPTLFVNWRTKVPEPWLIFRLGVPPMSSKWVNNQN